MRGEHADSERYKKIIEECFPQVQIHTFKPILKGWDSFVFEINGELIFRFPKRPEIEVQLEKEILLLPELAKVLSVSVPRFEFVWNGNGGYDRRFVGYRKIDGIPLASDCLKSPQSRHLAQQLSTFLSELHHFPVQRALRLKVPDASPAQWRQGYQNLYEWVQEQVFSLLETPARTKTAALWENFLTHEANFQFRPILIHADLGNEHILCDPDRSMIVGIIDWEDATIGDPALDFVGLLCDNGPDFTQQVLASYQGEVDETFWQRMIFYSRIIPFYEIRLGLVAGDEAHLHHGLECLRLELFK